MTQDRIKSSRRRWIAVAALASLATGVRAIAAPSLTWSSRVVPSATPLRQIRAGEAGDLLAVGANGTLWSYAVQAPGRMIADGVDPATPVASGYGRIIARSRDGSLVTHADGRTQASANVALAEHAGLLNLPFAIIGVATEGRQFRVLRFEQKDGQWKTSDRSEAAVMPDARPILAALEHPPSESDPGHVVVLAGPDEVRYQHGVLGDRVEASRILWFDRHSLRTLRELTLPAPFVFEDIAPRIVSTEHGSALLTIRSGGEGTQLALIAIDRADAKHLRIIGIGDPLNAPHRWLSPTTDGHRLMAVHTPHIGGVLNEYRIEGERLASTAIVDGVANHRIGTRELDLALWMGTALIIPSQDGKRLRVFNSALRWEELAPIKLPARVVMTAALTGPSSSHSAFAALLEDGVAYQFDRSS